MACEWTRRCRAGTRTFRVPLHIHWDRPARWGTPAPLKSCAWAELHFTSAGFLARVRPCVGTYRRKSAPLIEVFSGHDGCFDTKAVSSARRHVPVDVRWGLERTWSPYPSPGTGPRVGAHRLLVRHACGTKSTSRDQGFGARVRPFSPHPSRPSACKKELNGLDIWIGSGAIEKRAIVSTIQGLGGWNR